MLGHMLAALGFLLIGLTGFIFTRLTLLIAFFTFYSFFFFQLLGLCLRLTVSY